MVSAQIAFIDHYDSFSQNLIEWLHDSVWAPRIQMVDFQDISAINRVFDERRPLVLSPGPKSPDDAPSTMRLLRQSLGRVPILGVCLGHQMLGVALGGRIVRSQAPRHGRCRIIHSRASAHKFGLPPEFSAAAYNSLVVERGSIPDIVPLAFCEIGEVQALGVYLEQPTTAIGVQFHPESFLSQDMSRLRDHWLAKATHFMGEERVVACPSPECGQAALSS